MDAGPSGEVVLSTIEIPCKGAIPMSDVKHDPAKAPMPAHAPAPAPAPADAKAEKPVDLSVTIPGGKYAVPGGTDKDKPELVNAHGERIDDKGKRLDG